MACFPTPPLFNAHAQGNPSEFSGLGLLTVNRLSGSKRLDRIQNHQSG